MQIQSGDTLYNVGLAFNVNYVRIAEVNEINLTAGEQYNLQVGRWIEFNFANSIMTVKEVDGSIVSETKLTEADKNIKDQPLGADLNQSSEQKGGVSAPSNENSSTNGNGSNDNSSKDKEKENNGNGNENGGAKDEYSLVTVEYVDAKTKEKLGGYSGNIKQGQKFTAKADEIDGYNKPKEAKKTIIVGEKAETITFEYTKKDLKPDPVEKVLVEVKYQDKDTKEVIGGYSERVEKGKEFKGIAKEVEGYNLPTETTKTVIAGKGNIVFDYTKKDETPKPEMVKSTINHVDDITGAVLATTYSAEVEKGTDVTVESITIEGYTLKGSATQTLEGGKTATFRYTKNETPKPDEDVTYSVVSVVKVTNEVIASTDHTAKKDTTVTVNAPTYDGFTLADESSKQLLVGTGNVVFYYTRDEVLPPEEVKVNVPVNLIDQDGQIISSYTQEGVVGHDLTVTVQTPAGYTALGQLTQTQTVTEVTSFNFYFEKEGTVVEPEKTFEETFGHLFGAFVAGQENGTIGQFSTKDKMLSNADAILYSLDNIWYSGYDFKQTQQGKFIAMFY